MQFDTLDKCNFDIWLLISYRLIYVRNMVQNIHDLLTFQMELTVSNISCESIYLIFNLLLLPHQNSFHNLDWYIKVNGYIVFFHIIWKQKVGELIQHPL